MRTAHTRRRCLEGFTLIELLVVLSIVALLASLAAPRYLRSLEVARERALATTLATARDAIDQFVADRGRWPASLAELAEARYLRELPMDPITGRRDTWVELAAVGALPGVLPSGAGSTAAAGGIGDLRSGAAGRGSDGRLYADW